MNQAKRIAVNVQPALEYGVVKLNKERNKYLVEVSFGEIAAMKVASCLLKPEPLDQVLVSVDMDGRSYILHVLERNDHSAVSHLSMPGECRISSEGGALSLEADSDLSLFAGNTLGVSSGSINVQTGDAEVCTSRINLVAAIFHQQIKRIVSIAQSVEHSFKWFTQRFESTERFVEDHEEIQTGSTRYLVEDTLTTQAGNTLNISDELHTMHAEQIHMS